MSKHAPNFASLPTPSQGSGRAPAPSQPPMPQRRVPEPVQTPEPDPIFEDEAEQRGKNKLIKTEYKWMRRIGCWGFFILLVIFIVITAVPLTSVIKAYVAGKSAEQAVNDAKGFASAGDFSDAANSLVSAESGLSSARSDLGGVGFWGDMPWTGTQVHALEDASDAGVQALDAAHGLLEAADAISTAFQTNPYAEVQPGIAPTRSYAELSPDEKRDVLQRLSNALPDLREARDKTELALELWQRVPQAQLASPIAAALKPLADGLPAMEEALDASIPLIQAGLPFAGYPSRMRYLILLQNSDELRPTGGFIGSLGVVDMDGGDLKALDFSDVYSIDNPVSSIWKDVPPQPIADRLGVKAWFLRDSNWSPDFPTSAARVLDVYQRETALEGATGPAPTGVVAFTPAFFKAVLQLTGPVTVSGTTYTADNFFDTIEYQVEQGFLKQGTSLADRKAVLGQLGAAVMDKLKNLPASQWGNVIDLVTQSLDRKQIQAYSSDPQVLSVLDQQNWSGRAKPTNDDFLWVVDANLAALKTDGVMSKQISYKLDATDPQNAPTATVTLTYTNTNKVINWEYTRYRSYTRVYVPDGSQLISSSGAMLDDAYRTGGVAKPGTVDVFHDLGKTVFGAFWSIEPGQTGTLSFTYRLPQDVASKALSGQYSLDWPKEAGADNTRLTLDLRFGKNILAATPAEPRDQWGDAAYSLTTDTLIDRNFQITLQP